MIREKLVIQLIFIIIRIIGGGLPEEILKALKQVETNISVNLK